jgi:hypothetical protein
MQGSESVKQLEPEIVSFLGKLNDMSALSELAPTALDKFPTNAWGKRKAVYQTRNKFNMPVVD